MQERYCGYLGHVARAWDRVALCRAIDARIFARELAFIKLETRSLEMVSMAENIRIHVITITTELRLTRSDLAEESLKGIARLLEAGTETHGFVLFRRPAAQPLHGVLMKLVLDLPEVCHDSRGSLLWMAPCRRAIVAEQIHKEGYIHDTCTTNPSGETV
jgi:hypothetical protein